MTKVKFNLDDDLAILLQAYQDQSGTDKDAIINQAVKQLLVKKWAKGGSPSCSRTAKTAVTTSWNSSSAATTGLNSKQKSPIPPTLESGPHSACQSKPHIKGCFRYRRKQPKHLTQDRLYTQTGFRTIFSPRKLIFLILPGRLYSSKPPSAVFSFPAKSWSGSSR